MKQITVLAFGAVSDIIGKKSFTITDVQSTDELKQKLEADYPALKYLRYAVAVDKQLTAASTPLDANATVALLPPFSGG
ncbi:MAG TPA: MoaD/ThiS family protein [Flavisolibacter sp.]|nr:MoaD/ThiS family protein [Flavisolibacter sp.]